MERLSALLIVKNEEKYIARALQSLVWCDEIVVVDSFSTDRTREICLNARAPWHDRLRFIDQEWLGFASQRNFAIAQANHNWVFFLDADEACSPELATAIQKVLAQNPELQFKVRRQEYFLKKPIHFGIWNPSTPVRLFRKAGTTFVGEVHEGVESPYPIATIEAPILHVEDLRIERFLDKLNKYTSLQAQEDYQNGVRTNFFKIFLAFPAMFYKNYVYYRAYRDGRYGLIISALEGISRTIRHLKIWQLEQIKVDSTTRRR